ncbi:MAG: hypothetical protein HZB98_13610 [Bacteroidia bacterium]|nr:hypothetical protein [Bacteroidia bacterium]
MNRIIKIASVLMLLFNGIGAIYGGLGLILDPTGGKIQLAQHYLDNTPFDNYMIPGIILLLVNGLFSFITIGAVILKHARFYYFIIAQGILLTGWLVIQLLMIRTFYAPMHVPLLAIGFLLLICGIYFYINKK